MLRSHVDAVTCAFESGASVLAWINVRAIYRDKKVHGIWWPGMVFFLCWGFWSLFLYPAMGFHFAQIALAVRLLGHGTWFAFVLYYGRKK